MMVDIFIKQEYHCFNFICFCFLISFCHALFVQCLKHASTSDIPVFDKLIQLEISFGNYSWDLLASLLQRSHKLEVLTIYKVCWVEKRILFFMLCAWIWEDLVSVIAGTTKICKGTRAKMDPSTACSWMPFTSQNILPKRVSRIGNWAGFCRVYYAKCQSVRDNDNLHIKFLRFRGKAPNSQAFIYTSKELWNLSNCIPLNLMSSRYIFLSFWNFYEFESFLFDLCLVGMWIISEIMKKMIFKLKALLSSICFYLCLFWQIQLSYRKMV